MRKRVRGIVGPGRAWLLGLALGALGALAPVAEAGAQAPVQPYATNDFGGFHNVLPPGENGFVNLSQLIAFEANGTRPAHFSDQRDMYANLIKVAPDLNAQDIGQYYKDSTFGVPTGNLEGTESPRADVTIVRDKGFGVPHIYGSTRTGLMFGIGYATAEDRLFFIDVLRHYGGGQLASFAGGSNAGMDAGQWLVAPYSQQDLQNQVDFGRTHSSEGPQIYQDGVDYVAGINAYITNAKLNPNLMPGEYAALGMPQGPAPFQATDLILIASLVGGIFGQGGGNELSNAMLEQSLAQRFGLERGAVPGSPDATPQTVPTAPRKSKRRARRRRRAASHRRAATRQTGQPASRAARLRLRHRRRHLARRATHLSGYAAFQDFNQNNDPEAPTTVHNGAAFPYRTLPARAAPGSLAMPDAGSVQTVNPVVTGPGSSGGAGSGGGGGGVPGIPGLPPIPGAGGISIPNIRAGLANRGMLAFPRSNSNALLVSGAHSTTGRPIAVMGPQVAYFAPQILMEEDIHGPGIDAEGASFPGVNQYVQLGHGPDYAWSATSSGQDIVDTFAVPLCDPSGAAPTKGSDHYLYQGQCVPMETLTRTESWTPNPADQTPPGSQTLQVQRTKMGLVVARATVGGRPVAYTRLRATYMHELDSAVGFEHFNEPAQMRNPAAFMNAANQISYTFNWFYIDDQHIAYFNSGANPVRAANTNPLFPVWASFPWQGYNGDKNTFQQAPQAQHPQVVDQNYLTSWNNKQAPGYANGDTGQEFSSIYRSQVLDNGIKAYLDNGRKMGLVDLINAMASAATQDLRGVTVLPFALQVLGHPSDPQLAQAVNTLYAWFATGSHRLDRSGQGHYDHAQAVQIMDAWWPLLVQAEFGPRLGAQLLRQVEQNYPINDQPGHGTSGEHLGSSWDVGFYGVVQKDLRAVLGQHVTGPLSRVYCGQGQLAACRAALLDALHQAIAQTPQQVYPADGVCATGDQGCSDSIRFRPLGAVTQPLIPWQNRPTFQQAIEIQGHGPRQ